LREAQKARDNRAEIVKALSQGQVSRRELFKWGIFTVTGALALKNGLSPFANSAYAAIPTGTPPTPLWGALPFTQEMPRLNLQTPHTLTRSPLINGEVDAIWPAHLGQRNSKRLSWHTDFNESGRTDYINPMTGRGPCEGRPHGEWFAHQLWTGYFPTEGYLLSLGQVADGKKFHSKFPAQHPNSVWSYGGGGLGTRGTVPPPLLKIRYGEPVIVRIYNSLPRNRADNNGFGRNEVSTHNHNAHNGPASDGANNAYFFPGQFYDYHWATCLARADTMNTDYSDARACGPKKTTTSNAGGIRVRGDYRELQSTLWFHDHRFFFTAENVYKGNVGMMNYYSGPDRGFEGSDGDPVNLRLPSGTQLPWGNIDFDVNLVVSDFATDPGGQLFFDIFDTDGFLGDRLLVNGAYSPFFNVMRRRYRFRILNGCMARFLKLALVNQNGDPVPMTVIANDGNFLPNPVHNVTALDTQGSAERFDVIIDFTNTRVGDRFQLVNHIVHANGRGPKEIVAVRQA
jgi:FtsP/CotA-like multicopper oxidase with cupredoxin domain